MKILLAEDDRFLAHGLSIVLKDNGYCVDLAFSGTDADLALAVGSYDLLILDLGLPKMDGMQVLSRLRSRGMGMPVLVLTARESLQDRVSGLDIGANDYMTKPFEIPELEARIRALLRKDNWGNRTKVNYAKLQFNTVTRVASVDGKAIELSYRELSLLELLLQGVGRLLSKDQLVSSLSSHEDEVSFNALGITVHRLRKKLEKHGITINVVRGLGYRLETLE